MFRLCLAALLLIVLIAGATVFHLLSTAYLLGVVSGLAMGMALWMRGRARD